MIPKRKQFLAVNVSRRDEGLHKRNGVAKSFFLFSALLRKTPINIMPNNLLTIYESASQNVYRGYWNIRGCLVTFTKINDTKNSKHWDFQDVIIYNVESIYQRFGRTYCHKLQGTKHFLHVHEDNVDLWNMSGTYLIDHMASHQ